MPVTGYTYEGANNTFLGAKTGLNWRADFSKVQSGVDPLSGAVVGAVGSGMAVSQASSNLVITTGTTANADTIVRLTETIEPNSFRLVYQSTLSQRISNQQFFVELVDVIGDALAITIASATSATVTIPNSPFTSANVGQAMYLGAYAGTGVLPPNRYAIASVSGNNVTFTVSGATAGSGTVSAFGWNYHHVLYDGTGATATKFDTQTKGWCVGDAVATISSTAAPGHIGVITAQEFRAAYLDTTVNAGSYTNRVNRNGFVPTNGPLYVQIRAVNGTTAPASTTTFSVGFVAMADFIPLDVAITDTRPPTNTSPNLTVSVASGSITSTPVVNQSVFSATTSASTNAASMKTSAGTLYEMTLSNPTATAVYVKLYNKASAPTVGTDVPIATFAVPATSSATVYDFGAVGKRFTTGIAIAVTAAIGDADTGNAVAGAKVSATYV